MRFKRLTAFGFTCVFATLSSTATAQSSEVSSTGKGITGGVLLGAEAVMAAEAAFGVKSGWAYVIGGGLGAVGGGVAGYFAEQGGDAKLSLYLLAGGMAFAIPTTVAVLSATSYEPPADYTEDRGPSDEPVADPAREESGAPGASRARSRTDRVARKQKRRMAPLLVPPAPPALVGLGEGALTLSVPAVEVRNLYRREQLQQFGVQQRTEWRVPVLNVHF